MVSDMNYWSKVLKKLFSFIITLLILYLLIRLSFFYLPFLIALVLAISIEPAIKFLMKHLNWSRKISSICVIALVIILFFSVITCGVVTLFNESNKLLQGSDTYFEKANNLIDSFYNNETLMKKLPIELQSSIKNSKEDLIKSSVNFITNTLTKIKIWITKLPNLFFTFLFSLMALYFMCTDKIYMIDQMEHHMPSLWTKKISCYIHEITKSLEHYLKAEITLISISFFICLTGLALFKIFHLNVEFPLLMAIAVALVDALPILGSSAVMIPWAVIEAINGDIKLAIALLILLGIMGITRNLLEPKLVSKHIGIHPVFTLIAMYTGYKIIGVCGMILGPILLIILKEVYEPQIQQGLLKSIFG